MTTKTKRVVVLVASAAIILVLVVVVAARSGRSTTAGSPSEQPDSTAGDQLSSDVVPSSAPSGLPGNDTGASVTNLTPTAPALPLDVVVSPTAALVDGQVVSIHVTPTNGSNIYAAEAFICQVDASYTVDADIRPSITGKCITKPLSANTSDYVKKVVGPPYQVLDMSVIAGVGSDSYATQQGRNVTITCDSLHPCVLVLKLQIPNSYGFRTFPLAYR